MEQGKKLAIHVLIGVAVGVTSMLAMSAITAWAISSEYAGEGSIRFIGLVVLTIGLFIGARVTIRQERQRTLICAVLTGVGILLLLLVMKMLWFPGWGSAIWWIAVFGSGAIFGAALLPTRFTVKKRRR